MNNSLNIEQNQMVNHSMPPGQQYGNSQNATFATDQWKAGFWGCCDDVGICCKSFCCPCIQYGQNHNAINAGGSGCQCLIFCLLGIFDLSWCVGCPFRTALRKRWGIEGNQCVDCLAQAFCACCAVSQEAREIKLRMGTPNSNSSNRSNYNTLPNTNAHN